MNRLVETACIVNVLPYCMCQDDWKLNFNVNKGINTQIYCACADSKNYFLRGIALLFFLNARKRQKIVNIAVALAINIGFMLAIVGIRNNKFNKD